MGFLLIFAFNFLSHAEYRTFELKITNIETGISRTVTTSLDHYQYPQYYPLNKNESIEYETSWMCWENTSHRQACPKPDPNQ
jgi:hypothetical protein